jgi:hypothetical protein
MVPESAEKENTLKVIGKKMTGSGSHAVKMSFDKFFQP